MSGRKSWEVANILSQTEDIQNDIFKSYANDINSDIEKIEKQNFSIESNKQTIQSYSLNNIVDIEEEFPQEILRIKKTINEIELSISKIEIKSSLVYKEELLDIQNNIIKLNSQANEIRIKIKNSSHYVDNEYNQAQNIKNELIILREKYRTLKHTVNSIKNMTQKNKEITNSKNRNLEDINKELSHLKLEAKEIKNIRNEAKALKNNILKIFNLLDETKAEKFLFSKYRQIEKEIQKFNNLNDSQVIEGHILLSASITQLNALTNQKYNQWLSEKNYSESFLNSVKEKGLKEELILLEDRVNGNDNYVSKFLYYDNYKNTSTLKKFNELISKSEQLYSEEKFQEANQVIESAKVFYEDISNQTDTLREHIEASANLAFKIRAIMLSDEINFAKAHLELIDDNPMNGFKLECQNGDTINFEKIKFDEEGNLTVDLDHIENTNGTCGVRWGSMQKVFNQHGIPLTDVQKNGHSVIYRDVRKKESKNLKEQRG